MGIFQRSTSTAGKVPVLNVDIFPGQIAINKADGTIFFASNPSVINMMSLIGMQPYREDFIYSGSGSASVITIPNNRRTIVGAIS